MERLIAGAVLGVARVESLEIKAVDRVADELGQVALRQPLAQGWREQEILVGQVRQVAGGHELLNGSASPLVDLLPPRLLAAFAPSLLFGLSLVTAGLNRFKI